MQGFRSVLLVGTGGFLGSIARYLIGGWVHSFVPFAAFPLGTLAVNALGCFGIGLLGGFTETRQLMSADLRVFLMLGVLGGFTTFSSFAYETLALARDAEVGRALANVAAQVVVGLAACWLGYSLVRP